MKTKKLDQHLYGFYLAGWHMQEARCHERSARDILEYGPHGGAAPGRAYGNICQAEFHMALALQCFLWSLKGSSD